MQIPDSHTSLRESAEWFRSGLPMLMYHKLGPRPWGTRIKGLYVGEAEFRKQLEDLRAAGYQSASLDDQPWQQASATPRVIISFDDGFENTLRHGVGPLQDNGYQAIQYIVANRIGGTNDWDAASGEVEARLMDKSQIRDWLAAGQQIGSHSLRHVRLAEQPENVVREEVSASKKKLEDLFGLPIRHFCYPYGSWSPMVRDCVIEAGYETASTVDKGINQPDTPAHELKRVMARDRAWTARLADGFR